MSTIFGKDNGRPNRVKRNSLDLSFQNNGSYQFGYLYPVMCKEVLPGDTFDFSITAGLRFMPMVFPVQTRMRVDYHAFYVRNRNLWKDWPDFIGKTKDDLIPPFIGPNMANLFNTGTLADYLGIPTTLAKPNTDSLAFTRYDYNNSVFYSSELNLAGEEISDISSDLVLDSGDVGNSILCSIPSPTGKYTILGATVQLEPIGIAENTLTYRLCVITGNGNTINDYRYYPAQYLNRKTVSVTIPTIEVELPNVSGNFCYLVLQCLNSTSSESDFAGFTYLGSGFKYLVGGESVTSSIIDYAGNTSVKNPFIVTSSTNTGFGVSALPFRAYEAIYNSFYRDDRNNPRLVNGQPEYNKYITTDAGGNDTTIYKLQRRNWEQDLFTTALPSPQQGNAPLVGISSTGVATFVDTATGNEYRLQAVTADDSDTITNFAVSENIPNSVARSLVSYATSGISINDFRNVNAYQRWLETNIRRGLKYRDQIKSHFDVDVSYQELDMPEFIGGTSIPINVGTVNQTSESSVSSDGSWSSPLGSYAGQAFGVGSSRNRIHKYFDEHGFIMVIMSVVPVPNYSQAIEKFWFKTDALDYFFPEFGHIGLQAIPQKLLSPIQTFNQDASLSNFNKTFGYQRPWYEYLSSLDEIHGLMRTQLNNFVLNRVFSSEPNLSPSFTTIDPAQLNDIFAVTDITDKILGQTYFDIKAKRPIPLYGVPRLESDI